MGYRIVRMTKEIFEQLFVEGYTLPARGGERLRVAKGLPAGAKLVSMSLDFGFLTDTIWFKFSHPSWPDQPDGYALVEEKVEYVLEAAGRDDADPAHLAEGG